MPRLISHVIARRKDLDPGEPRDWALLVEELLRGLVARFGTGPRGKTPEDQPGRDST